MLKAILVLLAVAAGATALGYGVLSARSMDHNVSFATLRVQRESLVDSAVALGVIKPQVGAEVKVGSRLSGVVTQLNVNVGDTVVKGAVLARVDDAQWRARVASLEAELAAAAAELEYARAELARMERVPSFSLAQIDERRRNLRVREASLGQTRARLDEARVQLGYTRIAAPISGTVASVSTYEGETVAADFAAPTFVTLLDPTRLELQAYVDEHDIGKVHSGRHVNFRVDAYPAEQIGGRVRTIYPKPQLQNNVVNYIVIVDIEPKAGLVLRPEMTAHVDFILEQRNDVVVVPPGVIVREHGRTFVLAPGASGIWARRPIVTGMTTVNGVEIRSGLTPGDLVMADPRAWQKQMQEAM